MKKVSPSGQRPDAARPVRFYGPRGYRPEESVAYLMRAILNNVASEVGAELVPTGLTHAQWVPLFKLYTKLASTVAELARECRLDTGATTRMLDRLEAKGLVGRTRSTTDRRVVNLELTPLGLQAAKIIPAIVCKVHNRHLRGFSEAEWELLKSLLRRMIENAAPGPAGRADSP